MDGVRPDDAESSGPAELLSFGHVTRFCLRLRHRSRMLTAVSSSRAKHMKMSIP